MLEEAGAERTDALLAWVALPAWRLLGSDVDPQRPDPDGYASEARWLRMASRIVSIGCCGAGFVAGADMGYLLLWKGSPAARHSALAGQLWGKQGLLG